MTEDHEGQGPQLFELPVRDLLRRTAERTPDAGGGAMSVLAASASLGLVIMVARFAGATGDQIIAQVEPWTEELPRLADRDAAGFDALLAARRKPSDDPQRTAAIAEGVRRATEVPLRVCEIGGQLVEAALLLAAHGKPDLTGDALVGAYLAQASVEGAAHLVRINTAGYDDPSLLDAAQEHVARVRTAMRQLSPEHR